MRPGSARDADVAGERDAEARAGRGAVHGRENRAGRGRKRARRTADRVEVGRESVRVARGEESREELRVEAAAERVGEPRQDDGGDRRILRERGDRVGEHLGHVGREGVPRGRSRELYDGERALEGNEDERLTGSARGARPCAAGVEERLEEGLLLPISDEIFRVPLHAGEEGALGPFERLDEIVRRRRESDESRSEVFHALVVARIDRRAVQCRDRGGKLRIRSAGPDAHRVRAGRIRVRVVREAAGPLFGEVLPQGSAERHVHDLKPAADAEDGCAERFGGGEEREVEPVAFRVELERLRGRSLAVAPRVYIASAREEQAVERPRVRILGRHDDDLFGQRSRREQGCAIDPVRLSGVGRDDDLHVWRGAFGAAGAARGWGSDYREDMGFAPRVVVTGMGARTAFGRGRHAFWRGVLSGQSAIREVTRFDTGRFRARHAALIDDVSEREARDAGRETILARDAAGEALGPWDTGASRAPFGGARSGVAVGTTLAGNDALTEWLASREGGPSRLARAEPGALARGLAELHGARGPVSTVSVACASGAAAVGLAAEWIRSGDADLVLAGGADAVSPFVFSGFDALRALSPSAARPFDASRDGLTLGEGAGFLLLEEEAHARRRGAPILAFLEGYGTGSDAHHMTRPDPLGRGLVRAVEAALREARRPASDVGFVSAHGTATTFNDAMEEAALAHVLGPFARIVPVNGIKGAIGHTLGAAGALEAVLSVLVLLDQVVPPTAGHTASRAASPLAVVSGRPLVPSRPIEVALSTSAAFGGTNAALVFSRSSRAVES